MPLYQEESVENEEKLKVAQVFFVETRLMFGTKEGGKAINLLEDWPSQARAGPAPNAHFRC